MKQNTINLPVSKLTKSQTKNLHKTITWEGNPCTINAHIRYDDKCGNGHNSFSITGEIIYKSYKNPEVCGCIHEEIEKHFPELKKYIKWHLTSSDGPMHYIANTIYHAGDKDYNGKRKDEADSFDIKLKFGDFPITFEIDSKFRKFLKGCHSSYDLEVLQIDHNRKPGDCKYSPKYTFGGFAGEWYEYPFDTEKEAMEFLVALQIYKIEWIKTPTSWSEGKDPDIKAGRSCAIWPEATQKQLTSKTALLKRLPALMQEFKKDMEELGFVY